MTMTTDLEDIFGELIGDLDFSYEPPEGQGVYLIIEVEKYDDFLHDDEAYRLDGLMEVFVKWNADGELYAAGEDIRLEEGQFDGYVWAKKSEMN